LAAAPFPAAVKPAHPVAPYLFLAPALAVFAFAIVVPMLFTVAYSFTDWNGFGAMTPVGLDNYVAALTDPIFRDSFLHVLGYIAATLVLEVGLGLVLAGIVSARAGTVWFRVAFFAPVMLPMVVVAILWSFVYNGDFGLLNATLGAVGLAPLQRIWLGDTSTALLAVSVVSGWVYAGFYMTIFYAAIRQIPHEVVEAARIDGAGEWALFRRVKVPMIRNALAIAVLLCVTGGFQGFDLFFVLTNGGPYGATEIPTTYLVKVVFRDGDVGYGSAMAVILTAVVLGIGFVYARLTRRAPRERGRGERRPVETPGLAPVPAGIAVGPGGTA
jgi:raffinose/stachyose/melibiose transport system permease protein